MSQGRWKMPKRDRSRSLLPPFNTSDTLVAGLVQHSAVETPLVPDTSDQISGNTPQHKQSPMQVKKIRFDRLSKTHLHKPMRFEDFINGECV